MRFQHTATASAVSAAALVSFGTAASAASVDLTSGHASFHRSLDLQLDDGTAFEVSASSTWSRSGNERNAWVGRYGRGLGVSNGLWDDHRVDGRRGTDTLWFDFATGFTPTGVTLTYVSDHRYETLRLLDGDGETIGDFNALALCGEDTAFVDFSSIGDASYARFGISAIGRNSAFKVDGLQGVSAVPTPTAAAAGIALLIGGACRRRRRTAV